MALVKPDETIIGGGGTTNTSQRGIYITWNKITDPTLLKSDFCFYEYNPNNPLSNKENPWENNHVVIGMGSGGVFLPISNECNLETDLNVISMNIMRYYSLTQGKEITIGGYDFVPLCKVTFHFEENYYYQNQKFSNDKGYQLLNSPLKASLCLEDERSIVESNRYSLDDQKIKFQKWNSNYFLGDRFSALQLKTNNKKYFVQICYSWNDLENFFVRNLLCNQTDWVAKYSEKYYKLSDPKETKGQLVNTIIRIKDDQVAHTQNSNWDVLRIVQEYDDNWVPKVFDIYYKEKRKSNDTFTYQPKNIYEYAFEIQTDEKYHRKIKITKDCAGLETSSSIELSGIDIDLQAYHTISLKPEEDLQIWGGEWVFNSNTSSNNDSFYIPKTLDFKVACDLLYGIKNKRIPIIKPNSSLEKSNFYEYEIQEINDYELLGYRNFHCDEIYTNDIVRQYCGPVANNCLTKLPVTNRSNPDKDRYNFIADWGYKLIRNVQPNIIDTPYKYKICLENNCLYIKRSDWDKADYSTILFSQTTYAKRFIIDVQAAGGSGASTKKLLPMNRNYPNGGGGGGAFVRLLVNLEDGDLYIGLEKTYIADDDRNSKHYTWVNYVGKDEKEIRINLGNGGMGQLQSTKRTNGLGGKVNFEQGINPNTDETTSNNLLHFITNFNYLNENKIKIIHCYYGKSAPEGIKAKNDVKGKFNGANGESFIEEDFLDNLNGTTTKILYHFDLPWNYTRGKGGISQDASESVGGGGGGASVLGFGLNGKTRRQQDNNIEGDESNGFGGGGGGGVSLEKGHSGPVTGFWGQHGCFIIYW